MAEEADTISFYVGGKPEVVEKLDAVCKKDDRSRSYVIMKVLEENLDKYLKR